MNWQEKLGELFGATVNQDTLEEAALMMVVASSNNFEYHNECVTVLKSAIDSCEKGETDSISEINKSGYTVNSPESAKEILSNLLETYLKEYSYEAN